MGRDLTQAELAKRAGIDPATVHRLEAGKRVHLRSLEKICGEFHVPLELMTSVLPYGTPLEPATMFIHRQANLTWYAHGDNRKAIPKDSQARIQNEEERLRLGRSGMVDWFQAYTFAMPSGPGMAVTELFRATQWGPSPTYRDCVTYCVRGEITLQLRGQTLHLKAGDGAGYSADEITIVGPAIPVGMKDLPPLVWHITANRVGQLPIEFNRRKRMRTRHRRTPDGEGLVGLKA
jgi:transcriptional regulator with XRE-family HTH domain